MIDSQALEKAALNLLHTCARVTSGERLLLVCEDAATGYHDDVAPQAVRFAAQRAGLHVDTVTTSVLESAEILPADLADAMADADHTVFFARIGDQIRFQPMSRGNPPIVVNALDAEMLASRYGTTCFDASSRIKQCFNRLAESTRTIHITCPLGTDITGPGAPKTNIDDDVSTRRFPMSIFRPVPAGSYSGQVALSRFLCGTGSRMYAPYGQGIEGVVMARVENGRVTAFDGSANDVRLIEAHYDNVAGRFDLDPLVVHSWHAGIHPGCKYTMPADKDFFRWAGAAFGNPRLLHFHTCGESAPGEISWSVFDASVSFDGEPVWDSGRILIDAVPGLSDIVTECGLADLFSNPEREFGVD